MRVVVKVGTSSLTDELGVIDRVTIDAVCDQIARLRALGHDVALVSSGAISAGVAALGLAVRPTDTVTLQALAAAGQSRLMGTYDESFGRHGLVVAQVLVVPHDFADRKQYLHARRTIQRLFELGCVPIVNENDALASDEIRFGDNDRIAALVAHNIGADVLVLLTDTEGLYTADPRLDAGARLIAHVAADDPLLAVSASASATARGSGGMASKLAAARIASWSGVRAVIAAAGRPDVLVDAVGSAATGPAGTGTAGTGTDGTGSGVTASGVTASTGVGTTFAPSDRRLPARKLWIGFASRVEGSIVVDDGARRALVERGTSLLPAGVVAVHGRFDEGDTVEVRTIDGEVIARGMVLSDAPVLRSIVGKRSAELPPEVAHEVIHRDDLVLLA